MNKQEKWYKDGLKFTCTQCGDCCTGDPGVVWIDDDELQQMADVLQVSAGEMRLMHTRLYAGRVSLKEYPNGDCIFLDPQTHGCKVYNARPKQCRTWPFWNSNLESPETWEDVKHECPGAGCGKLYTLEQIEEQAAIVDI